MKFLKQYPIAILWIITFIHPPVQAQNLTGAWQGILTQEQSQDHFTYQLDLKQEANSLSGTACSTTADGSVKVCFLLTGIWDKKVLILQEVQQTEPAQPKWCLKYMQLSLSKNGDREILEGDWKADNCRPGHLRLERIVSGGLEVEEEIPFTQIGTWTGYLKQSDRGYGFYYEVTLDEGGQGRSNIVSEDNGGSAWHNLQWTYDPKSKQIEIQEQGVLEKTDPRWKWCIKSGIFELERVDMAYQLKGNWSGYLEGFTPEEGGCAPGSVFLEKPILTQQVVQKIEQNYIQYTNKNQRQVKVDRVIEVQNENIRIKVWDNGTVDGDVVTIFLNGEQLLHNFRVSKRKWTKAIKLNKADNFLILHAEDLGEITPNTVAVSIDDGVKEKIVLVSSDLKTSGAIMIRKFRFEGN
ncbi:MAG: hypothetical protein DHS20C18_34610 [Saprospiraceae bacterium]|nr:MAG: hypothetical protein DHS20C18_34610 [Saprospiraceae bacterium]